MIPSLPPTQSPPPHRREEKRAGVGLPRVDRQIVRDAAAGEAQGQEVLGVGARDGEAEALPGKEAVGGGVEDDFALLSLVWWWWWW